MGLAGYLFGSALGMIIGDLKGLENYVLGGIALVGGAFRNLRAIGLENFEKRKGQGGLIINFPPFMRERKAFSTGSRVICKP